MPDKHEDQKNKLHFSELKGIELKISTGVGKETTSYSPQDSDDHIIGISISENYSLENLSKIFLTIEQQGQLPFRNVPLNVLVPHGRARFTPVFLERRGDIDFTLESKTVDSLDTNKPILVIHFNPESVCLPKGKELVFK